MEIRPIIGFRKNEVEFIVNTIVDIGFGTNGDVTFTPAARLARNFGENFALGIEYYTGLGPLQNFVPFNNQQHNIYAVTDFKIGRWDVNAGIGYGLTSASDRWMAKMIIGTNLNEGVSDKSSEQPKMMRRVSAPMTGLFRTAVSASEAMLPERAARDADATTWRQLIRALPRGSRVGAAPSANSTGIAL